MKNIVYQNFYQCAPILKIYQIIILDRAIVVN